MKRRLGNLKGAPIVEGDENLMTSNEVNYNTIRTDKHWVVSTNDTTGLKGNPDFSKGYKYVGTACFPVNTLVPKDVNVYSVFVDRDSDDGGLSTHLVQIHDGDVIPAGTGILITSKIKSPVFYQTTKTVPFGYYQTCICVYKSTPLKTIEDLYPRYEILVFGVNNSGTVGIYKPATGQTHLAASRVAWLALKD